MMWCVSEHFHFIKMMSVYQIVPRLNTDDPMTQKFWEISAQQDQDSQPEMRANFIKMFFVTQAISNEMCCMVKANMADSASFDKRENWIYSQGIIGYYF